jgi:DNA-directed RNA polymerase subunit RPC12/RpoP
MIEPAKKISEWDYQYENDITCPYCGYKDRDSWEHHMRDGDTEEIECGQCEKTFDVSCDVSVTYTSEPRKDGSDN